MQERGTHLAIVVDEHGATAGLVTIEDIAEQLMGSISEQPGKPWLARVGRHRWMAEGSMPVDDLADEMGVEIPEGEWNTVAGMMIGLSGRLLKPGESVELNGLRLSVQSVRRRRITRVMIARLTDPDHS
jgi:CBS domain containing-hemolysin-like protein